MTKVKKVIAMLLVGTLTMGMFVGCGTSKDEEVANSQETAKEESNLEPVEIVLATAGAPDNIETIYTEKWMDLVTERTDGKVTFDYTNGGALGGYAELVDGVNNGAYDMTVTDIGQMVSYVPELEIAGLPFLMEDYDQLKAVYSSDVFDWMQSCVEEKSNMKLMNAYFCGFRDILSKDELKTIEDFSGYLIRSPQAEAYVETFSRLGFSYTTLGWNECYGAMQTGIIDSVETALMSLYNSGFYDLGKYVLLTNHMQAVNALVINEDFWNSLPEEYKSIMSEAIEEIRDAEWEECIAGEEKYMTLLEEEGVTINEISDEERVKVNELFKPYWSEVAERVGGNSQEMIDKILSMAK